MGIRNRSLIAALLLGLLADQILRTPGQPGAGLALWAFIGASFIGWLAYRSGCSISRETWWLLAGATAFAALLAFRDAEALAVLSLLGSVILLGLASGRGGLPWAGHAFLVDIVAAAIRVGVLVLLGPLGWRLGVSGPRSSDNSASTSGRGSWLRRGGILARGILIGLPPFLILTAILMSADPVFDRLVRAALLDAMEPLLQHLLFSAMAAWAVSGYLRAFLVSDEGLMKRVRLPRPALPPLEIAVAVSLLNTLFLLFLLVQARYLFGGSGLVEVTPGLSYSDYARRGFFELVAATALVVPVLLIADWASSEGGRGRLALQRTSTLLVLLLVGVLASAAYRMHLYQEAYGLTEQRLYVSIFMIWLTGLLGWIALRVLRGRRGGFALAAALGGLACIALLHLLNPHAMIVRVNLARADSGAEYDGSYLDTLGAEAVPPMIARLDRLPIEEQCRVLELMKDRWSGERRGGWRSWNLGDARARKLVAGLNVTEVCR